MQIYAGDVPQEFEPFLTVREISEILRLDRFSVTIMIRNGIILGGKVGRSYRVPRSALFHYLEERGLVGNATKRREGPPTATNEREPSTHRTERTGVS